MRKVESIVERVYQFIRGYYLASEEDTIKDIMLKHILFGTCDTIEKDNEIIACVRWNITSDGKVCDVLDLFIKEKENGLRIMKHFIARNWSRFPSVKYIRFARNRKYPWKGWHTYPINRFLKTRSNNGRK